MDRAIPEYVEVGWDVERGRDAEELVEAKVHRAGVQRQGEVDGFFGPKPQVPLANGGGAVARAGQKGGQGDALGIDQTGVEAP